VKSENEGIDRHVGLEGQTVKIMNSNFSFFVINFSLNWFVLFRFFGSERENYDRS
jgi:hypothetical protein